ncbi:hypothetical protein [Paenibacillus sp. FSL R5-0519]|uniref:hypothetical protein n=1 Tax=Paenibacillus sp. FSL R5-0519 TaxID=2921648 RepID=UPI0030DAEFAB
MIQWHKYDPENPPELHTPFVAYSIDSNYLTFAEVQRVNYKYKWVEAMDGSSLVWEDVTHYAVINLPGEEEA